MQAFLAVQAERSRPCQGVDHPPARSPTRPPIPLLDDPGAPDRELRAVLNGEPARARRDTHDPHRWAPHIDETYSTGCSNLTYFDVEQRRLDVASDVLDVSIPFMHRTRPADLSVWQTRFAQPTPTDGRRVGRRCGRCGPVLEGPSAPLARTWPLFIRALVDLRNTAMTRRPRRRVAACVPVRGTHPDAARRGGDCRAMLDDRRLDGRVTECR